MRISASISQRLAGYVVVVDVLIDVYVNLLFCASTSNAFASTTFGYSANKKGAQKAPKQRTDSQIDLLKVFIIHTG
jgi:hypothetical protein